MIKTKLVNSLFGDLSPNVKPSGESAQGVINKQAHARGAADHRRTYRELPDSEVLKSWNLPKFAVFKTNRASPRPVQATTMWADVFRNMRPGDCFEVQTEHVPQLAGALRRYLDTYRIPGRVLARSRTQNTMGAVWFLSNETED